MVISYIPTYIHTQYGCTTMVIGTPEVQLYNIHMWIKDKGVGFYSCTMVVQLPQNCHQDMWDVCMHVEEHFYTIVKSAKTIVGQLNKHFFNEKH